MEERHLFLPALVIDGELVPFEWFSAWGIVDLVEERVVAQGAAATR